MIVEETARSHDLLIRRRGLRRTYLDDEELWLPAQCWAVLVVELLVDGLGRDDAGVRCVDLTVSAVTEDGHDHHVAFGVSGIRGKVFDGAVELEAGQVPLLAHGEVEALQEVFQVYYVIL